MIEGSKKTRESKEIKESNKIYFLITDAHSIKGICTTEANAVACVLKLAMKHKAKRISDMIYQYSYGKGVQLITAEAIRRIKAESLFSEDDDD